MEIIQVIIALLATAVSFVDVAIAERKKQGADVADLLDARHGLAAVIALLRGDADADARIEVLNNRRKDKS